MPGRISMIVYGLGLLAEADCCVFGRRPMLASWNIKDFKHFYQSLWAVRRRVEAKTLVAERLRTRIRSTIMRGEGTS